tara:strand:+ start:212 stop:712 length:501 start_codon:yes stop_codon:yes gene_type:complete
MIGEIALALKALDSAYSVCKNVVGKAKDLDDCAKEVNKFLFAKAEVDQHIAKAKREGKEDLFEGSAIQEAISISQLEQRQEAMMARIGQAYSDNFKAHIWAKIKKDAEIIQRKRDAKAKRKEEAAEQTKKKEDILIEQLAKTFLSVIVAIIIIAGFAFMVFGSGVE